MRENRENGEERDESAEDDQAKQGGRVWLPVSLASLTHQLPFCLTERRANNSSTPSDRANGAEQRRAGQTRASARV